MGDRLEGNKYTFLMMKRIMITGAFGQIGSELITALQTKYGDENVLPTDIREPSVINYEGLFEHLDVQDGRRFEEIVKKYNVGVIYHLAALLSAKGEQNPQHTWQLNVNSTLKVLELARKGAIEQVFYPSSIAVYGSGAPRVLTPQHSYLNPDTMYGITKLAGEQLCAYYRAKYHLDIRSLRYPGLVSYEHPPGGGTTDYVVDMFQHVIRGKSYVCYLKKDTLLPMMYMNDAIRGTLQLMDATVEDCALKESYNFAAMSFSPAELAEAICEKRPGFEVTYRPDERQKIADSWPQSIDDSSAQNDWKWRPSYDLPRLVGTILDSIPVA